MSYHVTTHSSTLLIRPEHTDGALQALLKVSSEMGHDINDFDDMTSLYDVMIDLGFDCTYNDNELISDIYFDDGWRDHENYFVALAPYFEDRSEIFLRGEDDLLWAFGFLDGQCYEWYPELVFDFDSASEVQSRIVDRALEREVKEEVTTESDIKWRTW